MTSLPDLLFILAGIIFCAGVIPLIWHQSTVPWSSSLVTSSALVCLVVAYVILGLWVALISISANLFLWLVVALQRWGYTKKYTLRGESRAFRRRKHKDDWRREQRRTRLSPSEVQFDYLSYNVNKTTR